MRDFTEDILRSIDGGVITLNLSGSITKINTAARRILRIPEEVPEAECLQYIPSALLNSARRVLEEGKALDRFELQVEPLQGPPVPIDLNVSLLESADHIIGAVVTFYDLTQVRTLKEQVRRQERLAALGTLTAGIAHEIRNPLGIIKGAAEILQKRFGHLREEEGLSEFILEEVQRLSSVLTDFLDFARPQIPNFSPADLNPVLRRSLQLANLPGAYPNVEVELDLADRLPILQIDPDQCQQAFLNLILNAAQAMPEGGKLTIRSRLNPNPREVIAEIQDTGAGIGEEAKAEIFNPFFTTKDEGTGLGLSIVHRIVENHDARISFESASDKGTLFRICFPVDKGHEILMESQGKLETAL
jgi:two-component system sensor histidine kinase HydH